MYRSSRTVFRLPLILLIRHVKLRQAPASSPELVLGECLPYEATQQQEASLVYFDLLAAAMFLHVRSIEGRSL